MRPARASRALSLWETGPRASSHAVLSPAHRRPLHVCAERDGAGGDRTTAGRAAGKWGETVLQPFTEGWRYPKGRGCAAYEADGIPAYDPVLEVAHKNARPRIAIMRNRQPRVRGFRSYAELNESGQVRGDARRVEFELERKRRDGRLILLIAFRVNVQRRPYFQLYLSYPRRGECAQGGHAAYGFGIGRE